MTIATMFDHAIEMLVHSWLLRGLAYSVATLIVFIILIGVLLGGTMLLHLFFKHHPLITRARRFFIYVLTMSGMLALVIAGIMGFMLPLIPGIPFLLAGLLLLRRHHKWPWLEERVKRVKEYARGERRKYRRWKRAREARAERENSGKP
jgi:fatty acid desaturase